MSMNQMQYAETKGLLEEVQRQPVDIRREILTMLRGAIVISDMYVRNQATQPPAPAEPVRPSA